jgi:hypothetical protein
MSSSITVGGNTYTLIPLPAAPCFSDMQFSLEDSIATVISPYNPNQIQTQEWLGADGWSAQVMLPPLDYISATAWRAFLADCRGMLNVFQVGDQSFRRIQSPNHALLTGNLPVVDGSSTSNNPIAAKLLYTKGWIPNQIRLLMPGDYFQVGYRLYMVTGQAPVNSDADGKAQISVFPSLRDTPPDATPLVLENPVGLFRMAKNKRDWHTAVTRFTTISFPILEVR